MNQPTWEDLNKLKEEFREEQRQLKEEVRKLREQITEPIKVTRVEVASADVERRLDNHAEMLKEISQKQDKFIADVDELKLDAKAYTGDAAIFKNKVERIEIDVSTIKEDVGTLKTNMEQVKTDIGTIKTIQNGHSKFFEEHGKRLNLMATKDDIATMATKDDIARLEGLIKQLLQQKPNE